MLTRVIKTTVSLAIALIVISLIASCVSGAIDNAIDNGYEFKLLESVLGSVIDSDYDFTEEDFELLKELLDGGEVDGVTLDDLDITERTYLAVFRVCMSFYNFMHNSELRERVLFIALFWIFCILGLKGSTVKGVTHMSYYVTGIANKVAKKVISFPKPWWFWGICLFTNFIPFLVPLGIYITLKFLIGIVNWLLAPIVYPAVSYYVAVTSND